MSVTLEQLRLAVQENIDRCHDEMHMRAGIVIARGPNAIVRDAVEQTDEINWTTAYQQRTLTFLNTALTLLEIFSKPLDQRYLSELDQILKEMDNPHLWQTPKRAQANFNKFNERMYEVVNNGTAGKILKTEFNHANGWISMEKEPYEIHTRIRHNKKEYEIRSEPYYGLTDKIKNELENRVGKKWYIALCENANTKKICDYYLDKIVAGELHQLPPTLRGRIPGIKNAYRTSVWCDDIELVHFYHAATLPMGNEDMEKNENIRLTQLNYDALSEKQKTIIYTTLVSRFSDIPLKMVRGINKNISKIQGKKFRSEELIDGTIADIGRAASSPEKGQYHTNVCLNAARLFEPFSLEGFGTILKEIYDNSLNFGDENFKEELEKVLAEFKKIKIWNLTKFIRLLVDRDKELRVYNFLTSFALLIHKYNNLARLNAKKEILWIFSCASGQNRTQILAFMVALEAIYKNTHPAHENTKKELSALLAISGHFSIINGPYDNKYGIRSKSASSFSKSIRLYVESLITPLADTKRAGDKQYDAITAQKFLDELEKADGKNIDLVWREFLKLVPSQPVLTEVFDSLLYKIYNEGNCNGYKKYGDIVNRMLADLDILERLMSSKKHFHVISFFLVIKNTIDFLAALESKDMTADQIQRTISEVLSPIPYSFELKVLLQIYASIHGDKAILEHILKFYDKEESENRNPKSTLQVQTTLEQLKENIKSSVSAYASRKDIEEGIGIHETDSKIEIRKQGNTLFSAESTDDRAAVNVTIHNHEKSSMQLAVQVLVDAIPHDRPKEIYISVGTNNNDQEAQQLMIQYSCLILTNRAIPILVKDGIVLSREESQSELLKIAKNKNINLGSLLDFEYDLINADVTDVYDETIQKIDRERNEDVLYLKYLNENKFIDSPFDVCSRLIDITFLNRNLSQKDLREKIIEYKGKLHGEKLNEVEVESMGAHLQQKFANYTRKPNKIAKDELTVELARVLETPQLPDKKLKQEDNKNEYRSKSSSIATVLSENSNRFFNNMAFELGDNKNASLPAPSASSASKNPAS